MPDYQQLDPFSTQGVLQKLLGGYEDDERKKLLEERNQAQRSYLDTMNMPAPDIGPVNRMVSDYLSRYSQSRNAFGSLTGALGAEGARAQTIPTDMLLRRQEAAKEEARIAGENLKESDLYAKGLLTGAGRGQAGGKWVQAKDKEGNLYLYNNSDISQRFTVPAVKSDAWDKVYRQVFDKLTDEKDPDAQSKAVQAANYAIQQAPTGNPLPAPMLGGQRPAMGQPPVGQGVPPPQQQQPQQIPGIALSPPKGTSAGGEQLILKQFADALKMAENPTTNEQGIQRLKMLQELYPAALSEAQKQNLQGGVGLPPSPTGVNAPQVQGQGVAGQPAPVGAPLTMGYRNIPKERAAEKTWGNVEEEYKTISKLGDSLFAVRDQLNTLREIYSNPNIPSGELAEKIQAARSGMESLGIKGLPKTLGMADLANAVSGKFALTSRTAEGENLLPGAMSNYEDQMLRSLAPTLNRTADGRMALIDYMDNILQSRQRMVDAAHSLATKTDGQLPPEWRAIKAQIMKREQEILKQKQEELLKRFGGK